MRLLFVKLKHIGDTLLLTPTLTAARARHPAAQIWVVVRRGCEGILAGCPAIDRVLTSAAPEPQNRSPLVWWQDVKLIRQLRRQKFDFAFELTDGDRGRVLVGLSGAKTRCANVTLGPLPWWCRAKFNTPSAFHWLDGHRVEKDFFTVNDCLPLGPDVPALTFVRERIEPWPPAEAWREFVVVHPGARWLRKRWPRTKWAELGRELLAKVPRLVVSVGPDPEEVALGEALVGELGPAAFSTGGKLSWAQLAGLLYRARLFVGVDTAAMHLAAACQCPTVALFGPSVLNQWQPWRVPHRVVFPRDAVTAGDKEVIDAQTVEGIAAGDVLSACRELLPGAG